MSFLKNAHLSAIWILKLALPVYYLDTRSALYLVQIAKGCRSSKVIINQKNTLSVLFDYFIYICFVVCFFID